MGWGQLYSRDEAEVGDAGFEPTCSAPKAERISRLPQSPDVAPTGAPPFKSPPTSALHAAAPHVAFDAVHRARLFALLP